MSGIFEDLKHILRENRNPVMKFIIVNITVFVLIALLYVIVLLFQIPFSLNKSLVNVLAVPASLQSLLIRPWSLFTYMFVHEGVFHILFNMLVLFWFGNILTEYLGPRKFIYTYFLGGLSGAMLYILFFNIFPVFKNAVLHSQAIGASAAVMATVFASATLLPDYSIRLAIFGTIRLKYIALFYLIIDLIGIGSLNSGGHIAHLGGALFGFILIKQLRSGNDWIEKISKPIDRIRNLFYKKSKIKVVHKTSGQSKQSTRKAKQSEIDTILDKISRSGYDSLNKTEKEILFKASKEED